MFVSVSDVDEDSDGLPRVMTTEQVADLLHTTSLTVNRLARRGELPGKKVGGRWVFLRDVVLEYLRPGG